MTTTEATTKPTAASVTEDSGYLSLPGRDLYLTRHRAAAATAAAPAKLAVLIASPFGEERKCAYRLLVQTARRLAAGGCDVVRVEVRGAGDSTGEHGAATLGGWQDDLAATLHWLRSATTAPGVVLLGARLGANLMARLAAAEVATGQGTAGGARLAGVMAWAPLLRGTDMLEELARRKQIKAMMGGTGRAGGGETPADDDTSEARWAAGEAVDFDGFAVGAGLAAELRELDLVGDLDKGVLAGHIPTRLLHVSGSRKLSPPWQAVADRLTAAGAPNDLTAIREKPFWGRLDTFESEELIRETEAFCESVKLL